MVNFQPDNVEEESAGKLCPHCAKIIRSPAPTCPYCNMPLDELIQMEAAPEFKPQRWRWLLRPRTMIVSVLTVAVVLGLYGFIVLQQYSNEQYTATADRLMTEGNTSAAAEYYRKAVQFGSQDPELYEKLGWAEYQLARDADALKSFESAVSLQPDRVTSLYGAGLAAYQLRDYQKSISFLKRVIEIDPGNADAYEYLGLAEYRLSQYEMADEHLNTALIFNPQSGTIFYYLARLEVLRGEHHWAIENFTRAESFGFDSGAVALARGQARMMVGEYESAKDDLQKAVTQFPGRKDANLLLAKTYYLLGDYRAAQSQLSNIQENIPQHLQIDFLALPGWIALRQGNFAAARDTFSQIANMDPNNAESLNALGWAYFYSGDCALAQLNFEKAAHQTSDELVFAYDSFFNPNETPQAGLAISCPLK
ncbi:MAG: tetratricopeptide repeat protein [Chloroflexi bacterium]|nr:tetratricopeptide repeat protein [Chloroflexota bacterium]